MNISRSLWWPAWTSARPAWTTNAAAARARLPRWKRVGRTLIRLQEKVDGERGVREAAMAEFDHRRGARRQETHDDKFQTVVDGDRRR